MKRLQAYLNALPPAEQADFARRCGTTIGYLRKAISKGQKIGEAICIAVERESNREVQCEDLRQDVDWAFLRNTRVVVRPSFVALPPLVQRRAIAGEG